MRVLLVVKNSRRRFSGGRLHAWRYALALARRGHTVVVLTNERPLFSEPTQSTTPSGRLEWLVGIPLLASLPNEPFDVVLAVPHLRSRYSWLWDWTFRLRALARARRDGALLALLSFETPNWRDSVLGEHRADDSYRMWKSYAPFVDTVVSSTAEGARYARDYFQALGSNSSYPHCGPPIDSSTCDSVGARSRENRVLAVTRFSDPHKGGGDLSELIDSTLTGWVFEVICGAGGLSGDAVERLRARCSEHTVRLELKSGISEEEKFASLKRARALVFPSRFEGYGLPPIEALYAGTPVIAYDLPVFRETIGEVPGVRLVPVGDVAALRTALAETLRDVTLDRESLQGAIAERARIDAFGARLESTLLQEHQRVQQRIQSRPSKELKP